MNWADYLACGVCEAKAGEACYALLAAGPQALPSVPADRPHSARKQRGASRKPVAESASPQRAEPAARRATNRNTATAKSWAEIARRQGKI